MRAMLFDEEANHLHDRDDELPPREYVDPLNPKDEELVHFNYNLGKYWDYYDAIMQNVYQVMDHLNMTMRLLWTWEEKMMLLGYYRHFKNRIMFTYDEEVLERAK